VRIKTRLRKLEEALMPRPRRIAAAVVEQATGRVVQVLRGDDFEAAPEGLDATDLPVSCEVYPFLADTTYLGTFNKWTGKAAVTIVHGIDLDVVTGKKPGLVAPFKSAPPELEG
jgi:hypothetical protein